MNPVFQIIPISIIPEKTNLAGEITQKGFTYFFERAEDKMIMGLSAFNFGKEDNELAENLKMIFKQQPLLNKNYNKVCISYSMPQSVLVPSEFYKPELDEQMLNTIYGDAEPGIIFADKISDGDIYNVYRVPLAVHHAVTLQFPLVQFHHQYSLLIKNQQKETNILQVIFYQEKFVALLIKEGKLQIVQTYNYVAAEDISYHLLNICRQFEVTSPQLILCGMIEKDSALFTEIHKYFLDISFAGWDDAFNYDESIRQFPSHFFAHQFAIGTCV